MFSFALRAGPSGKEVVRAQEVQRLVDAYESRDAAAGEQGRLCDCTGRPLVFVQQYHRADGTRVTAHFRHDDAEHAWHGEAGACDATQCTPRESNERLEAMQLLRQHLGTWTVSQWCCRQASGVTTWSAPPNATCEFHVHVPMPGDGSGAGRVPFAVYDALGSLVLAVDLSKQRHDRPACRLPHVRLSPSVVVKTLSDSAIGARLRNLDHGVEVCEACMAKNAQLRAREIERGRRGKPGVLFLCGDGLRVPLVPGDRLGVVRREDFFRVFLYTDERFVKVGFLRAPGIPKEWRVLVRVLRPNFSQVPVRLHWLPKAAPQDGA